MKNLLVGLLLLMGSNSAFVEVSSASDHMPMASTRFAVGIYNNSDSELNYFYSSKRVMDKMYIILIL